VILTRVILNSSLTEKKLKGAFVLTKIKQKDKEWLFIKKKDQFAQSSYAIKPVRESGKITL
jgi:hypothetical protein